MDGKTAIIRTEITQNKSVCEKSNCMMRPIPTYDKVYIYVIKEDDEFKFNFCVLLLPLTRIVPNNEIDPHFHIHTDVNNDFKNATFLQFNSSNIIDPNTLYNTV